MKLPLLARGGSACQLLGTFLGHMPRIAAAPDAYAQLAVYDTAAPAPYQSSDVQRATGALIHIIHCYPSRRLYADFLSRKEQK